MAVFIARADGRVPTPERAKPLAPAALAPAPAPVPALPENAVLTLEVCFDHCGTESAVAWSPDGEHIAYFTSDDPGAASNHNLPKPDGLHVAAADGSRAAKVADIASLGAGDAPPVDPRSLVWSPNSRNLAFEITTWTGEGNNRRATTALVVAGTAAASATKLAESDTFDFDWYWSPDGRHLAYDTATYTYDDAGSRTRTTTLHAASADGASTVELAEDGYFAFDIDRLGFAGWSPDGRHLVYFAREGSGDTRLSALYAAVADGSSTVKLAEVEVARNVEGRWGGIDFNGWSPDGRSFAYTTFNSDTDLGELFVAASDGSNTIQLAEARGQTEVDFEGWSPDSRHVAYTTLTEEGDTWHTWLSELFVAAADGTSTAKLAEGRLAEGSISFGDWDFDSDFDGWSPDSRHVAYTTRADNNGDGLFKLFVAAADGSSTVELAEGEEREVNFDGWSPDGRHLAFSASNALYIAATDGTSTVQLTDGYFSSFSWSPGGRHLTFGGDNDGRSGLFVAAGDGSNAVQVIIEQPPEVVWAPEGGRIAFLERWNVWSIVAVTVAGLERTVVETISIAAPCGRVRLSRWTAAGIVRSIYDPEVCPG